MFLGITAVLSIQVGLMAHILQSLKVWSLAEPVILTTIITRIGTGTGTGTGTFQAAAVSGATVSESRTVEHSSCMSYKSPLTATCVIVVTAAQVSCLVCFFECVSQQTRYQAIITNHQTGFKTFFRGVSVQFLIEGAS